MTNLRERPTRRLAGRFSIDVRGSCSLPVVTDGDDALRWLVDAVASAMRDAGGSTELVEAMDLAERHPESRREFGEEVYLVTVHGHHARLGGGPVVEVFVGVGDDLLWFMPPDGARSLLRTLDALPRADRDLVVEVFDVSDEEVTSPSGADP